MTRLPPSSTLFPYTTLFRSGLVSWNHDWQRRPARHRRRPGTTQRPHLRSEEHTSELQSRVDISYSVFFFNDTATTEFYTLSLHDALPIWARFLESRLAATTSTTQTTTRNNTKTSS